MEKIKILLVDDRPENLSAMELQLQSAEYDILKALSGEEALRHLLRDEVALILMDVNMPGMDGFETARIIKQREKTKFIPIIFITGFDHERYLFDSYTVGAVDYIVKPMMDPVVLRSKVAVFIELYRKNRALRKAEEKYRTIFENASEGIFQADSAGKFTVVNPAFQRMLGYTAEADMVGRLELSNLYVQKEQYHELMRLLDETGSIGNTEAQLYRKDGSVIWVSQRLNLLKDQEGQFLGYQGVAEDITQRKQSERMLKSRELQLAAAQKIARIGSWEWDLEANIVTWSDELCRIYGFVPGDASLTYQNFVNAIYHEDTRAVAEALENALRHLRVFDFEQRIVRTDGTIRTLVVHGEVTNNEEGKAIKLLGTEQDVTEQKQADRDLRESHERLRSLSAHLQFIREQERARIAREIHDELGQMLTGLKLDVSWLSKQITKQKGKVSVLLVQKAEESIRLIDGTIETVRKIAAELRPAILDLGIVPAIEWQTQDFYSRTGIECKFTCLVEHLELDRERSTGVFRILQETLTNVARHSKARKVEVTLTTVEGDLMLRVQDDGQGISDGQASGKTSLGLLGMRERAWILNGAIDFTGIQGHGTTVTLRVPLPEHEREAALVAP